MFDKISAYLAVSFSLISAVDKPVVKILKAAAFVFAYAFIVAVDKAVRHQKRVKAQLFGAHVLVNVISYHYGALGRKTAE